MSSLSKTEAPRQARASILEPGHTCWVVSPATSSGVLVDGEDYFAAFHAAAAAAKDSILLAGWQFDSTVSLLRGKAREGVAGDVRLLPFLRDLCRANPRLVIRILCWDYSPGYMFQREWLQDLRFNRAAPGQMVFLFDDRTPVGGSHHQKFAVIDGALAFVGSMDLCHARWDRRDHSPECVERREPYDEDVSGPYHEVQAWLTGPVVHDLQELFVARWRSAGGREFELPPPRAKVAVRLQPSIRIGPADVGLSRTAGRTLVPDQPEIREIERLHVAAIAAAEQSIYIESQYFGARAVHRALVERLSAADRPRLEVAIICPSEMHSFTERMAMQASQDQMFHDVRVAGREHGHQVGIYHVLSCAGDKELQTYIHSKVMTVDDRFLTVGSANLNNRSLGLDSELNVSWEASGRQTDAALAHAIRRVRVSLLAEHAGISDRSGLRRLRAPGYVAFLEELARRGTHRLRVHESEPVPAGADEPEMTLLDPDRAIAEQLFERLVPTRRETFAEGVRLARRRFAAWRRRRRTRSVAVNRPSEVARPPNPVWVAGVQWSRRFGPPLVLLALAAGVIWMAIALLRALF